MLHTSRSVRVSLASILAGVVVLGGASLWPVGASRANAGVAGQSVENPAFARAIAGTWVDPHVGGSDQSLTMNINADGTMSWWASWFFGAPGGGYENGLVLGVWEQTGPRQISTTELGYLNDETGEYFGMGRVRNVLTFSEDLQSFTFAAVEDIFVAGQDPTDPDEVPIDSFQFAGGPVNRLNFMD